MKLQGKSTNQEDISIADYYAVKPGSIWRGLKRENAVFWWLCIYLFFEYIRPQNIYTVIDFLPWGQIALIMTCVSAISDKEIRLVKNPANALFISFFIVVFLSSIFAIHPSLSFAKIDVPVNWVILYFLMITILNTEKRFFVFVLLFLLVNFKMSQFGFMTYAKRGFAYSAWGLAGSPGWFQNAGDFGIQMAIFAPLASSFVLALKCYWGRYKRLFFYTFPFTALVTIVGTASRGAQLGIAAAGIWFILKSRNGIKGMLGILIVGSALYSILPDKMLEEYNTAGEDKNSEHRLVLWEFGIEVVKDYPVLGIGYKNWINYCWYVNPKGLYSSSMDRMVDCLATHNTYIEAATQLGIIGFVLFLLNLLIIFILNARTRTNAKQMNNKFIWYIAHGLDGGLVACIVSSIFFNILYYPMFWVQLAMTVALNGISKNQLNNSTNPSHKP